MAAALRAAAIAEPPVAALPRHTLGRARLPEGIEGPPRQRYPAGMLLAATGTAEYSLPLHS